MSTHKLQPYVVFRNGKFVETISPRFGEIVYRGEFYQRRVDYCNGSGLGVIETQLEPVGPIKKEVFGVKTY